MKQNPISFQLKLNPEDFLPATEEEKQSQVIMGKRELLERRAAPSPEE